MAGSGTLQLDAANTRAVISALFVGLGALAFLVSALISGRDPNRESGSAGASILSAVVGALLFALSPACFLLLDRGLFKDTLTKCPSWVTPFSQDADAVYLFRILQNALWYLASVVGVGLAFGSLTMGSARAGLLSWLRDCSGVRFPIRTYVLTWDDQLSRVKPGGLVVVTTRDQGTFTGAVSLYSVDTEPRELTLSKYVPGVVSLEEWLRAPAKQAVLVTQKTDVLRVDIPSWSFKQHQDQLRHTAQALFVGVAAVGLLLVSAAAHHTGEFLFCSGYAPLTLIYFDVATAAALLALLLVGIGLRVVRDDFQGSRCAYFLAPFPFTTLVLAGAGALMLLAHYGLRVALSSSPALFWEIGVFIAVGVAAFVVCALAVHRWCTLRRALLRLKACFRKHPDQFDRVLEWLYLAFDLQDDPGEQWMRVRARTTSLVVDDWPLDSQASRSVDRFFRGMEKLVQRFELHGLEFQLVDHLRRLRLRERHDGIYRWPRRRSR